jgi:hypothetical protein
MVKTGFDMSSIAGVEEATAAGFPIGGASIGDLVIRTRSDSEVVVGAGYGAGSTAALHVGAAGVGINTDSTSADSLTVAGTAKVLGDARLMTDAVVGRDVLVTRNVSAGGTLSVAERATLAKDLRFTTSTSTPAPDTQSFETHWGMRVGNARVVGPGDVHGAVFVGDRLYERSETVPPFSVLMSFADLTITNTITVSRTDDASWVPTENSTFMLEPVVPDGTYAVVSVSGVLGNTCAGVKVKTAQGLTVSPSVTYRYTPLIALSAILDALNTTAVDPTLPLTAFVSGYVLYGGTVNFSGTRVFEGTGLDRYLYDIGSDQAFLVTSPNSLEAVTGQAAALNMRSDYIVSTATRVGTGVSATLTFDLAPSDSLTGYLAQQGAIPNAPRFVEFGAQAETLTVDGRTFQLLPSLVMSKPSGSTIWTRATVSLSHASESSAPQLNATTGFTLQTSILGAAGRGLAPFQATIPCDIELEVMEEFVDVYLTFPGVAPTTVEPVFSAVAVTEITVGAVTYPIVFKQTVVPGVEYMVRMLFDDFDANNLDIGSVTLTVTYLDADPAFPIKYRFVYRDCTAMSAPDNVPMTDFTAIVAFGNNRATADLTDFVDYDAFNAAEYNPYISWITVGASTLHMASTYVSPSTPAIVDLVYDVGERNVLVTGLNSGTARLTGVPARFTAVSFLATYVTTTIVSVLAGTDALPDGSTHVYVYLDRDQQYVLLKVVTRTLTVDGIVHQLVPVSAVAPDWSVITDDTILYTIPFAVSNVTAPTSGGGGGGSTVIKETTRRPDWTQTVPETSGALVVAAAAPLLSDAGLGAPGVVSGTSVSALTSRSLPDDAWYHPGDHPTFLPWSILTDVSSSGPTGSVLSSPLISAESSNDATVAAKAGTKALATPVGGLFLNGVRQAATPSKTTATLRVTIMLLEFLVPAWVQTASIAGVDCPIVAGVATAPVGTPDGDTIVVVKTTGTGELGIAVVGANASAFPVMTGTTQSGYAFLSVSDTDARAISTYYGLASGSTIAMTGYSPFTQGVEAVLFDGQPLTSAVVSASGVVTHSSPFIGGGGQVTVVGKPKYRIDTARSGTGATLTAPVTSTTLTLTNAPVLATIASEVYGTYLETPFIDVPTTVPATGATVDLTGCVNDGGYATIVVKLKDTFASFAETTATVLSSVATLPYAPSECVAVAIVSDSIVATYLPAGQTTFALAGSLNGSLPVTLLFAKDVIRVDTHDRASKTFYAWTSQTTAGRLESTNAIAFIEASTDFEPAARVDALTVVESTVLDYSETTGLAYVRTQYTTSGSDRDLTGDVAECVVLSVDMVSATTVRSKVGGMDYAPTLLVGAALEFEGALTVGGDVMVAGSTKVRNTTGDVFDATVTIDGNAILSLNSVEAMTVSNAGAPFFRNGVQATAVRTLSDYRGGDLVMLDGSFNDSALQHLRRTRFARDLYGHDVRVMPEQPAVDGHTGRYSAGTSCVGDWMTGPGTATALGSTLTFQWGALGAVPGAGDSIVVAGKVLRVLSGAQTSGNLTVMVDYDFGTPPSTVTVDAIHIRDAVTVDGLQLASTTAAAVHEIGRAVRVVDTERTRVHGIEIQSAGLRPLDSTELGVYVSSAASVSARATQPLAAPTDADKRFGVLETSVNSYVPLKVGLGTSQWTMTPSATYMQFSVNGSNAARIANNGSNAQVNFTGVHRCHLPRAEASMVGLLVVADREDYILMSGGFKRGTEAITVSESLPIVSVASQACDPRVFGVVAGLEDERVDEIGCFTSYTEKPPGDTRVYVNSVGEGAIWVVDSEGPVSAGGYVTTSDVPGYACAQGDDLHRSCTAAKLTMSCDFVSVYKPRLIPTGQVDEYGDAVWAESGSEPAFLTRAVLPDGTVLTPSEAANARAAGETVYRAAFLGCIYTC